MWIGHGLINLKKKLCIPVSCFVYIQILTPEYTQSFILDSLRIVL